MTEQEQRVYQHLSQFVSDHKKEFVEKVLTQRTRQLSVVLEDIFQSQNASAVIRTCECMGVQDVHIVENLTKYHFNIRVLKGADKWMSILRYRQKQINNTATCFDELRRNGYRILVADPSPEGLSIDDIDPTQGKYALMFGNELRGVSSYALEHADHRVRIPMYGFTESLNISVSVAIALSALMTRLRQSGGDIGLSSDERDLLRLEWYRRIVKRSEIVEREFLRTIQ